MPPTPGTVPEKEPGWFKAGLASLFTLRALDVLWYRVCDDLSGALILPMVVFSPWAFGTVPGWTLRCMTAAGMALGGLMLIKLFIREAKGYPAPRWNQFSARSGTLSPRRNRSGRWLTQALAVLTLAVLAECWVSAWNVAANYNAETRIFDYHPYVAWLPHSLDGGRTWSRLWMYLGLAGTFWAVRDWLTGMSTEEERRMLGGGRNVSERALLFPVRMRRLLWVLCVSGALLGLEAIVQRASGSNKLLFIMIPSIHLSGEKEFGPYAYRSNAAQYFNLLWPVCLGFWLTLQRLGDGRSRAHHGLLACAMIMAACPIISSSRAGALVSVGMMLVAFVFLGLTSISPPAPPEPRRSFKKDHLDLRSPTQAVEGLGQGGAVDAKVVVGDLGIAVQVVQREEAQIRPIRPVRLAQVIADGGKHLDQRHEPRRGHLGAERESRRPRSIP